MGQGHDVRHEGEGADQEVGDLQVVVGGCVVGWCLAVAAGRLGGARVQEGALEAGRCPCMGAAMRKVHELLGSHSGLHVDQAKALCEIKQSSRVMVAGAGHGGERCGSTAGA